jgi:hypothetical protein
MWQVLTIYYNVGSVTLSYTIHRHTRLTRTMGNVQSKPETYKYKAKLNMFMKAFLHLFVQNEPPNPFEQYRTIMFIKRREKSRLIVSTISFPGSRMIFFKILKQPFNFLYNNSKTICNVSV